ncbi:MAG: DinB family protein [Exilispira sp.]|jgi:hypothetical protein|nr:DinB family protein [Exilispira sp.]
MINKKTWGEQHQLFKSIVLKTENFDEAIRLCLELHAMVHSSEMSGISTVTFEDELWEGLEGNTFRCMPTSKDVTIAWNLWHLTRIEDITMNILVANHIQVINSGKWLEKLNVKVVDTGNAMTDPEILDFSSQINMQELRNYRIAVGKKTRELILGFKPTDLKRKMNNPQLLQRIFDEGAVLEHKDSRWLVDFWGRKNVAGILLMPITRHQMVHINDSIRLKKKCQSLHLKK